MNMNTLQYCNSWLIPTDDRTARCRQLSSPNARAILGEASI